MVADANEVEKIISGELIVGNHESIIVLGSEAQGQLRCFSKAISEILLNDNGDLEYLIHDIVKEIDGFQIKSNSQHKLAALFGSQRQRDLLIMQYNSVLVYIDKMTISLQLQEAQLIKDSTILSHMQKLIEPSIVDIEKSIGKGEEIIKKRNATNIDDQFDDWYRRLERRLDDLRISHTVLLQCQTQLDLMLENNRKLVDKILSALSSTIPIWRNQITLLLGIEKMNRNLEIQEKVQRITEQYINSNSKRIQKSKRQKEVDIEKLRKANFELERCLNELADIEKNDTEIRLEMRNKLVLN